MAPTQPLKISAEGLYVEHDTMVPPKQKKRVRFDIAASEADVQESHRNLAIRTKGVQRRHNAEGYGAAPYPTKAMSTRTGFSVGSVGSLGLPYRTKAGSMGGAVSSPAGILTNPLPGPHALTMQALQQLDAGRSHSLDGEDGEESDSEDGRKLPPPTRRSSYFHSDADDPTIRGPQSTVLPPVEPEVAAATREWKLNYAMMGEGFSKGYWYGGHVEHKANLETIERHWGGPLQQILPGVLRPLGTRYEGEAKGYTTYLIDPQDWDQQMVRYMRKAAVRCYLKEFIWAMEGKVWFQARLGKDEKPMGFTPTHVRAFYAEIKSKNRPARTLADVERDGPAFDPPQEPWVRLTHEEEGEFMYGSFEKRYGNTEYNCEGCMTVKHSAEDGIYEFCSTCMSEEGKDLKWCPVCKPEYLRHEEVHTKAEKAKEREARKAKKAKKRAMQEEADAMVE